MITDGFQSTGGFSSDFTDFTQKQNGVRDEHGIIWGIKPTIVQIH